MNDIKNPEELWTVQKAKLKVLFTNLHDEDFHYDYGKKDVMLELLQKKLGKSREELNLLLLDCESLGVKTGLLRPCI